MVELLLWPFIAGLVLTGIHGYFGLHVLARGVVFVDCGPIQPSDKGALTRIYLGGVTFELVVSHLGEARSAG